jgi:hypothetical protein
LKLKDINYENYHYYGTVKNKATGEEKTVKLYTDKPKITDYQEEKFDYFLKYIYKMSQIRGYYNSFRNDEKLLFNGNLDFADHELGLQVNVETLRKFMGDKYKFVLRDLQRHGYITLNTRSNKYNRKETFIKITNKFKSIKRSFRFNEQKMSKKMLDFHYRLIKYYEKRLGKNYNNFQFNWKHTLKIKKIQFDRAMEKHYYSKDNIKVTLEDYKNGYCTSLWKLIVKYKNEKTCKAERLLFFSTDTFSGRFHSFFSHLPKSLMKYTVLVGKNNYKTSNGITLDVVAAQMTLLANDIDKALNDGLISGTNEFKELLNNDIDIYEDVKENLDLTNRDAAKKVCMKRVFGLTEYYETKSNSQELFEKHYPTTIKYIKMKQDSVSEPEDIYEWKDSKGYVTALNKSKSRIIPREMQEVELFVFRRIWDRLEQESTNYGIGIPYISVHDSVRVPTEFATQTETIMNEELSKVLGDINFKVSEE